MTVIKQIWAQDCGWEYELLDDNGVWKIVATDYTSGTPLRTETSGTVAALLGLLNDGKIGCAWHAAATNFRPLLMEAAAGLPDRM